MKASRNHTATGVASVAAAPPTPPRRKKVIAELRHREDACRERAWELHGKGKRHDGAYELGQAHAYGRAARILEGVVVEREDAGSAA